MKKNIYVILLFALIILTSAILLSVLLSTMQRTRSPQAPKMKMIYSLKAENYIPIYKYESDKTGLSVVIADIEGPLVYGHFCLATKACDNDGLPHLLEHLIFHGSEKYPYKGILDLLANRCLASGTNAWTSVDHTCYTITTAGSDGFLSLLPIFLDHILYPTLKNNSYITEVHHITSTGDDAGVVYSEIQSGENTAYSRSESALMPLVYPDDCGYKWNTGGLMKNLRESTNVVKLREYHKNYYRPDNLVIVISGTVEHNKVFKALTDVAYKIGSKKKLDHFQRPWLSEQTKLNVSYEKTIFYPSDNEDNGIVKVAWRGPSLIKDFYSVVACELLCEYLTHTSASVLKKSFVEIDSPLANKVQCSVSPYSESLIELTFKNVPLDKIDSVKPRLETVLKSVGDRSKEFNMKEIQTIIHKDKVNLLSSLESNPQSLIATVIVNDALFGSSLEDLNQRLNYIENLNRAQKESEEFWIDLLKTYYINAPTVTIKAMPSIKEKEMLAEEKRKRIQKRIETLGPEGLVKRGEELKEAMRKNEVPPPEDFLQSVQIPSTDSIIFHNIVKYTTDGAEQPDNFNLGSIPIYTYLDHVKTNFIYIWVFMDTTNLKPELRSYLTLFSEVLLESPIKRDNNLIPYEDVVTRLEADTIVSKFQLGVKGSSRFSPGSFSQTATLFLELEVDKYIQGIEWLKDLLYNTVFTTERLKIVATKLINDIAQFKRNEYSILQHLLDDMYYNKTSTVYTNKVVRQQQFLTSQIKELNKMGYDNIVIKNLYKIREILTNPLNMALHLSANLDTLSEKYPNPADYWTKLLPENITPAKKSLRITPDYNLFVPKYVNENPSCIVGLGSVESSNLIQTIPSIRDYNDPDLPAVSVFLEYLKQSEGPMWKQIRGAGLAYGYDVRLFPMKGLMYLSISESVNVVEAYIRAKSILKSQINSTEWDISLLESAKGSLMFEFIENEDTIRDVVSNSAVSYFKGTTKDYTRQVISLINKVTIDDLNRVGKKYIAPLFDYNLVKTAIVSSSAKVYEIAQKFKEMKLNLKVYRTLEERYVDLL